MRIGNKRGNFKKYSYRVYCNVLGQDSVVGTAIRYGMDGPGVESQLGRGFPHPSRPALGPTQPPIQWVLVHSPPPNSAEVKERVQVYLYSSSVPSWHVIGRTVTLL
jgi:hypothetical protein